MTTIDTVQLARVTGGYHDQPTPTPRPITGGGTIQLPPCYPNPNPRPSPRWIPI